MRYNTVLNKGNMGRCTRRKQWEISMALQTLDAFGVCSRDKTVLGVGAGHEPTMYHLTQTCGMVVATDLYGVGAVWDKTAPADMVTRPERYAPVGVEVDPQRLRVQVADMRNLPFEDGEFDGVFSSGSIEHVGSFDDVAIAAAEIGRVLKRGGVASISTEFKADGRGFGWPGVLLFDAARLYEYLIEPSGLVPVDEPYLVVHSETVQEPVSLEKMVRGHEPELEMAVLSEGHGYVFTSVHLALRKDTW